MSIRDGSASRSDVRDFYINLITESELYVTYKKEFHFKIAAESWENALAAIHDDYKSDKNSWAYPFIKYRKLKTSISKNKKKRYLLKVEIRPYWSPIRFLWFLYNSVWNPY